MNAWDDAGARFELPGRHRSRSEEQSAESARGDGARDAWPDGEVFADDVDDLAGSGGGIVGVGVEDGDLEAPLVRGRRIAVMCPDSSIDGACFGAALAGYLAKVAAGSGSSRPPVALVDGQPGTGGLDVLLDLETTPGARWPALRGAGSHIDGERLLAALPQRDGVAVLSHTASPAVVDEESRRATHEALAHVAGDVVHCLAAHPLPRPGEFDVIVLLVRGTLASTAAAQHTVRALTELALDEPGGSGIAPVALVALETPVRTRSVLAESLGAPLVAAGPTRWRMSAHCPADLLAGRWPGQRETTMTRLVRDVSMFVARLEREPSWA